MNETISKQRKVQSYRGYRDTKMIGTLILLLAVTMQVFAGIHVPFFTTVHAYTIGMIFGYFNPFFYFYAAYYGMAMILENKMILPSGVKTTRVSYGFVALSIIFVAVSFSIYSGDITVGGTDAFGTFHVGFRDFTSNHDTSDFAWLIPGDTLGGLVGTTMYSFVATFFSGVGAIIVAVILLVISTSILVNGTASGLYRDILNRKKLKHAPKLEKDTTTFEIESITKTNEVSTQNTSVQHQESEIENPFDDPFDDPFGGE